MNNYFSISRVRILETCPSVSPAKQLLERMKQNKTPEKITWYVTLNSRLVSGKTVLAN